jgi:hypothetical protein
MSDEEISHAARQLAAQRRRVVVTCSECGTQFTATSRRRYCSNTCNVRAWRRARQAESRTPQAAEPLIPADPPQQEAAYVALRSSSGRYHSLLLDQTRLAVQDVRAALVALGHRTSLQVDRSDALTRFNMACVHLHAALAEQRALISAARERLHTIG